MGDDAVQRPCRCRICAPHPSVSPDAQESRVLEIVEQVGWNVMYVPPEDGVPGWAFTIGLTHSYGWPELIMCGLSRDLLHGFVNIVGEMAEEGQPSPGLGRLGDVIEGHYVELRPVDPSWHRCLVGWALWFAQHDEPEFVQIVWPDNQGHFPNEPEFDESLRRFQPDLGAPPWHHRLDAWRASAANLAWPWRRRPIISRTSLARSWRMERRYSL